MSNQTASPTLVANLSKIIRDYNGYALLEQRQKSDQSLRNHLITRIKELVGKVNNASGSMTTEDQERFDALVNSTQRKLITIKASLANPTYIGAPFFDSSKVLDQRLEKVYYFEDGMLGEIESLNTEIMALQQHRLERMVFEDHFQHIQDYIDSLNQSLFEREALILGDE